jgi:hypothetical protein
LIVGDDPYIRDREQVCSELLEHEAIFSFKKVRLV